MICLTDMGSLRKKNDNISTVTIEMDKYETLVNESFPTSNALYKNIAPKKSAIAEKAAYQGLWNISPYAFET